jgi:hypothetical protein
VVRAAPEAQYVVPPVLHQHADDALDAVANEGAAKLVAFLLRGERGGAREGGTKV